MTGRHTNITYSFLVVGHTKFSPDWCFGLFKRLFKRTKVYCMAAVIDSSVVCNVSQLVHTEDTEVVPTYDWPSFLFPHFRKLQNIKMYHHFRFSYSSPGNVFTQKHTDTTETKLSLLRDDWHLAPDDVAPLITPKGPVRRTTVVLVRANQPFLLGGTSRDNHSTSAHAQPQENPCKTKRANSGIGALFCGGLLRVVTRYYARRGRVITRLSVNKRGRTPKYLHSRALFRAGYCTYKFSAPEDATYAKSESGWIDSYF